jgi:hypothetical protein
MKFIDFLAQPWKVLGVTKKEHDKALKEIDKTIRKERKEKQQQQKKKK